MKVSDEIKIIIKERYNNYQGSMYDEIKETHRFIQGLRGDVALLAFLKACQEANPKPTYTLPDGILCPTCNKAKNTKPCYCSNYFHKT